jgi:hypothetical protein
MVFVDSMVPPIGSDCIISYEAAIVLYSLLPFPFIYFHIM